jgi:hypothetical protein
LIRPAVAFAILCICLVSTATAQDNLTLPSRPIPLPLLVAGDDRPPAAERMRLVEQFTREYDAWHEWHERWRNQPEPGWFSHRQRRDAPTPPVWLAASCADVAEDESWLVEGCRAWREWTMNDDTAEIFAQQVTQARSSQEAPQHTLWWERVHLDALWPMTQSGSSAFGLAGTHATFSVTKRFQVFMAPGVILMRLPMLVGGDQTWSFATDWGFSYRLADFTLPAMRRPSTLHFNIARVWVLGAGGQSMPGELYLAGLSLTFKQR